MSELNRIIKGLSPEQLALIHRKLSNQRDSAPRARIRAQARNSNTFPLSFGQQRFWFLNKLDHDSADYNIPTAVRLTGTLDGAALERSINEVVNRHEVLRTNFKEDEGRSVQVIIPHTTTKIRIVSLESLEESKREAEVWALGREEVCRPFDLSKDLLLRAVLLRLGAKEHILLLTTHHIVCDKWSHGVFMRELVALYYAWTTGSTPALPNLPVQYADYACWQREWLQHETLSALLDYWRQRLEGAPASLNLPTDRPRTTNQTFKAARHDFAIDKKLTARLKSLGQQEDATVFMILMAVFNVLLYRYTSQAEIVTGFLSANRNRAEIENLIGQFANTLVLRTKFSDDQTFRELLNQIHEHTLGAYAHQDLPFDKLVEELQPARELGRVPLFEVAFNLQKAPLVNTDLPDLSLEPFEIFRGPANLDLYVEMEEREQELVGAWEYNADLFDAGTIEELVAAFHSILEDSVERPETKLGDFALSAALTTRIAAARTRDRRQKIAIAAGFTAEPIADSLTFWMEELGLPAEIEFAAYNQVFQQLLDSTSLFSTNQHGVNIVLVRLEDWMRYEEPGHAVPVLTSGAQEKIERNVNDLIVALRAAAERSTAPHLVCICAASPAVLADHAAFISRMEDRLVSDLAGVSGVYVISSAELSQVYPVENYYDPHSDQLGHVPYTLEYFTAAGTMLARKIYAVQSAPYKVIVLDCDETLWQGVCGEDGVAGIRIDVPQRALQDFIVAQREAGMLVCLCSKNNEDDVFAVFDQRADMVLRREDLVAWRINWLAKSENIQSLAAELQLGLDSFIFIDDDPVVCAEVEANCPGVLVLPTYEVGNSSCPLERVWAFDRLRITADDRERTAFYQQNMGRERMRKESATFADFLAGLDLRIEISPLALHHVARVAQLSERTNQFNTSAVSYSESDIKNIADKGDCLVVEVSDRFGHYGLVGAVIAEEQADSLEINLLMLSCRVLGRGVEHRVVRELGARALARGLTRTAFRFKPTGRNKPAEEFLRGIESGRRITAGDGYVFEFPVAALAEMTFQPAATPPGSEPEKAANIQSDPLIESSSPGRTGRLRLIATELSTPQQILRAIEDKKRRSRIAAGEVFVSPRTPVEEMLAEIWCQALGVDKVGVHDNFFKLGGHSLLGTMLISKVIHTFHVEVSLRDFYRTPTVAGLAEVIELYQLEQGDPEYLTEMMAQMDALSDAEISALLAAEGQLARDQQ